MTLALSRHERGRFHCRVDSEHSAKLVTGDQCKISFEEVGRFYIIASNGLPDHEVSSNNIRPQNIEVSIPKMPTLQSVRLIQLPSRVKYGTGLVVF